MENGPVPRTAPAYRRRDCIQPIRRERSRLITRAGFAHLSANGNSQSRNVYQRFRPGGHHFNRPVLVCSSQYDFVGREQAFRETVPQILHACRAKPADWFDHEPTARMVAAAFKGNTRAVKRAHADGGDPNYIGQDEITPLMWVLPRRHRYAGIKALLKVGADPNYVAYRVPSIMAQVARRGDIPLMKPLVKHGGNPGLVPNGFPLPITAAFEEQFDMMRWLMDAGADINALGPSDQTLIMLLTRVGYWEQALAALDRGADWRIGNRLDETVESLVDRWARRPDVKSPAYWEVVDRLRSEGAVITID